MSVSFFSVVRPSAVQRVYERGPAGDLNVSGRQSPMQYAMKALRGMGPT